VVNATPRPLYTRERETVLIVQEAGWAPGPVWTGAENLVPTGIRSAQRPARSESLYRLRYPRPLTVIGSSQKFSYEMHFRLKLLKTSHVRKPFVYFKGQTTYRNIFIHEANICSIQYSDFKNVVLKISAKRGNYLKLPKITCHSTQTDEEFDTN
jgi:hypothetical protein